MLSKKPTPQKLVIFLMVVIASVLVIAFFLSYKKADPAVDLRSATQSVLSPLLIGDDPTPTPTVMPFADLTIPHLRERAYVSTLSELERISESQAHTSYLTGYDSDGLNVNGLITRPKGEMPQGGWPAIIFVHGYIPPTQYRTAENYNSYVHVLAREGFVVFKIDLRGHGTSEGEPGGAYYSSDYVIDVLNAKAALASSGFVDREKIGFWGHSMAGNVIFRALATAPETPAIVIWAGAVYSYEDFRKYGIDDNSYRRPSSDSDRQRRREELFATHGEFDPESPFWKQVAATNYVDDMQGAVQLHHSVDDGVVDIGFSRELAATLMNTQVPHEFHEYAGGGHNFTGASFTLAMERTVAFFREHLE